MTIPRFNHVNSTKTFIPTKLKRCKYSDSDTRAKVTPIINSFSVYLITRALVYATDFWVVVNCFLHMRDQLIDMSELIAFLIQWNGCIFLVVWYRTGWRSNERNANINGQETTTTIVAGAPHTLSEAECVWVATCTCIKISVAEFEFTKNLAWAPHCPSRFRKPSFKSFEQGVPGKTCKQMIGWSSLNRWTNYNNKMIIWRSSMEGTGLRVKIAKTKVLLAGPGLDML